jgi:hypothetical protein
VAVGLAKTMSSPIAKSFAVASVKPASITRPARISPAPSVSITLAACARV